MGGARCNSSCALAAHRVYGHLSVQDLPLVLATLEQVQITAFGLLVDQLPVAIGNALQDIPLTLDERLVCTATFSEIDDGIGDRVLRVRQFAQHWDNPVRERVRVAVPEPVTVGGVRPIARLEQCQVATISTARVTVQHIANGFPRLEHFKAGMHGIELRDDFVVGHGVLSLGFAALRFA